MAMLSILTFLLPILISSSSNIFDDYPLYAVDFGIWNVSGDVSSESSINCPSTYGDCIRIGFSDPATPAQADLLYPSLIPPYMDNVTFSVAILSPDLTLGQSCQLQINVNNTIWSDVPFTPALAFDYPPDDTTCSVGSPCDDRRSWATGMSSGINPIPYQMRLIAYSNGAPSPFQCFFAGIEVRGESYTPATTEFVTTLSPTPSPFGMFIIILALNVGIHIYI